MQGLVIANIADLYKIKTNEKVYEASARGKLKNEGISPVVGDNVEITITDEKNNIARIDKIKERKVYIKRPKLANISKLILVVSSKDPKPDLLMLDKQLAFAEFLGIKSMIVLNKADLDKNKEFEKIKRIYENINYKVCITEAKLSKGIEELKRELLNEVSAFSGNSGVGKSTLINHIFESQITEEGKISKKNKRGKNTTTSSFLYTIDNNTYLADTPGFSTFGIDEIESRNLAKYFVEFDEFSKECEFIGCSHIKEECCNIKKAVETGKISKSRYENYCKIYEELRKKELRKW